MSGKEEHVAAELDATRRLQAASTQLIGQDGAAVLYETILDAAVAIMRSQYASIQMLYPERGELRLLGFRGFNAGAAKFWEWVRPASESTCGRALRTGERCIVGDVEKCDFMAGSEDLRTYRHTGIRAVQTTPLVSRAGVLIGMISTHWREPHEPSERDLHMLDALARQAADAIERGRAQDQARRAAEQFKVLLDQAPIGVYLVDADFRIREVNPVALAVFGDIPGGVIGRDFDEIIHLVWEKKYADELVRIFRHTLETGEACVVPERAERRIDRGITEYYEWRLDHIPLPDGRHGVVCYFRDISEQVIARKEIEASREALREADRRKDELLAVLAHELRNPLAPIRTAVQLLHDADDDAQMRALARGILQRQVQHAIRLVDDLLDLSRITQGTISLQKRDLPLAEAVESAVETSRPHIEAAGHELQIELPPQPLAVCADPVRLAQVISNLLNNAAKYTPQGGRIHVEAREERGEAVVSVSDTGSGIPADVLPRIFDMFSCSGAGHRPSGGLGIGLWLSRQLLDLHGGTIEARSPGAGRGAEFVVRLPAVAPVEQAGAPAAVLHRYSLRRRVLVVDDNRDAAESLGLLLQTMGHEVRIAHDGRDALEAAGREPPEILLLDMSMPMVDGYGVAAALRKDSRFGQMRIVALTGFGQERDRARAREAGCDEHLVKPVDLEVLRGVLERYTPAQS